MTTAAYWSDGAAGPVLRATPLGEAEHRGEQRDYWRPRQAAADEIAAVAGGEPSRHWMEDGACIGTDPELFFPPKGASLEPPKRICRGCPVQMRCLEYAVDNYLEGVWGATSEAERTAIRRQWNRTAA